MFDDAAVELFLDRAIPTEDGGLQWFGREAGSDLQTSVLSLREGRLSGMVLTGGAYYRIEHIEGLVHRISEVEALRLQQEDDGVMPPNLPGGALAKVLEVPPMANQTSGNYVIDILICYTPNARNSAGGATQIADRAALSIAESNSSLANSGIHNVTWRLAGTVEVSPNGTEVANSSFLSKVTYDMPNVAALRDQYGADVVSFWIDGSSGGTAGIGWIMPDVAILYPWYDFSSYAFNVVETRYARGPWYTFPHEVGHNMGAAHNRENATNIGAFGYAYGYQQKSGNSSQNFYTLMSYSSGCSGCTPVNNWSNPDVYINGLPSGVPIGSWNAANNAKAIQETAALVAGFRDPVDTTPTNRPPTANNQSVTTPYQTSKGITLSGSDPDGDSLGYDLVSTPSHGSLTGSGKNVTYHPHNGYHGGDAFVFRVSDGRGGSAQATVSITVQQPTPPPNRAPTANNQSVSVEHNGSKNIVLTGSDPDGDSLTYKVLTQPGKGSLSGTAPNLVYRANSGATGGDNFTFSVNDGKGGTAQASVSVTIAAAPPAELKAEVISLSGLGPNWETIAYGNAYESPVVVCTARHASNDVPAAVRVRSPNGAAFEIQMYSPGGGSSVYGGADCLIVEEGVYSVTHHGVKMEAVRYTSSVTDHDDSWVGESRSYQANYSSPVVLGQVMTTNDNRWSSFWASGADPTTSPTASALRVGKHAGEDANTYRANEIVGYVVIEAGSGVIDGVPYRAGIGGAIITGPDDGGPVRYYLNGLNNATAAVASASGMRGQNGGWPVLAGVTPVQNNWVELLFDEDQMLDSERSHAAEAVAVVAFGGEVGGGEINQAPQAFGQSVTTAYETAKTIVLTGSDPDSDPLTFQIVTNPSNGSLSGSGSTQTYRPANGYSGADSFVFRVSDNRGGTAQATVTITVQQPLPPPNNPPTANNRGIQVEHNTPMAFSLSGSDPDGDKLTFQVITQPSNGSLSGSAPHLTYTPKTGYSGNDTFFFTANDGRGGTSQGKITLKVAAARVSPTLTAEVVSIESVGPDWQSVGYQRSYSSPVVVCTPRHETASIPALVRVSDTDGSGFRLRIASPGMGSTSAAVDCLVVEEGVYTTAQHGVKMEAVRFTSKRTDHDMSWVGDSRSYQNAYGSPVVIGQVMTVNDARFSSFWAAGASAVDSPSASALRVGKHVGEDEVTTRADEVIGYIVMEAGLNALNELTVEAGVTPVSVRGPDDGAPAAHSLSSITNVTGAVLGVSGMRGMNGGWPLLAGSNALSGSTLRMLFDEDQLSDDERAHTPEAIAYVAFGTTGSVVVNKPPTAKSQSKSTAYQTPVSIQLQGSDPDGDSLTYGIVSNPKNGSLTGSGASRTYTPKNGFSGSDSFAFKVSDGNGGSAEATVSITVGQPPVAASVVAETFSLPAGVVGWRWVQLSKSFRNPVVVCTPQYQTSSTAPMYAQVASVSSSGFLMRTVRVDGSGSSDGTAPVYCLAVEEGVYNIDQHGIKMEAVNYTSKVTNHQKSWTAEKRGFSQSYSNPVVLGQVLSANGSWSVFWAHGSSFADAPGNGYLYTGKHVGEDPDINRPAETVGYIVLESGSGTLGGASFSAGVTDLGVQGGSDFKQSTTVNNPKGAVLSMATMTGWNGAWPLLSGSGALNGSSITITLDEDTLEDAEREHQNERVGYFVFK